MPTDTTTTTRPRITYVTLGGLTYRLRNVHTYNDQLLVGTDATGRPQYFTPAAVRSAA